MSAASRRKRKGKPAVKAPRQDFTVQQVRAATQERRAPKMLRPVRCKVCGHRHDAARVEVLHYVDCQAWRCPGCGTVIDDRPERWGGTAIPVEPTPPPAPVRRGPKRLPWEGADQPDHVDPAIADLMRKDVARRQIRTHHPARLTDPDHKDRR